MGPGLELRIGQSLTMTPALQQAIRLLQLNVQELEQEVQLALESNIMLEADGEQANQENTDSNEASPQAETAAQTDGETKKEAEQGIPDDLPFDCAWDEIYDRPQRNEANSGPSPTERLADQQDSLQQRLLWQLSLEDLNALQQDIASSLIDALDQRGYLSETLASLQQSLETEHGEVSMAEIEAILQQLQACDPIGVGARSLEECLLIQLREQDLLTAADVIANQLAQRLVSEYLSELPGASRDSLCKRFDADSEDVNAAISLIRQLKPNPAAEFTDQRTEYIVPEVYVKRLDERWQVSLNPRAKPRVRVNEGYAALSREVKSGGDRDMMRQHLQEARWLIRSLESRSDTLLRVAECIVETQQDYFNQGDEALKPLVLREVAELLDLHESTVSRVTNGKYMHTANGLIPFRFFFSSHVSGDQGDVAATAIHARIKKLVASESPQKPLSDSRLAKELDNLGIKVARRTIAKYREQLGIAPSHERKRLA